MKYGISHLKSNDKGSRMTLMPFKQTDKNEGGLNITITGQSGDNFKYGPYVAFNLNPIEVGAVLSVFRGMEESINYGKGLFKQDEYGNKAVLKLSHVIVHDVLDLHDPTHGYLFTITETEDGGKQTSVSFSMTMAEGVAVSIAIEQKLGDMMFGDC